MARSERQIRALRPARPAEAGERPDAVAPALRRRVLMVDLNNFASFPTLAIGLLAAALRNRSHEVQLISPLAHDVPAAARERRESWLDHAQRRIHLSDFPPLLSVRDGLRSLRHWRQERPHPVVLREVARAIESRPDAILLSAYLQHFNTVREIGRLAAANGIPVLLGGPMFNVPEVAEAWRGLPGLAGVVGAEADRSLPDMVEALCAGEDVGRFPGVTRPDGARATPAPPLRDLDATPFADFTDFPWDRYPVRIVPLMTGRGCQWDKCLFCSDVVSVSGRTFRTRSVENVLLEMQEQARRHATTNFLFLDLKLNSYPDMIRGIAEGIGGYVRGAEWIGTVHVDQRRDNGLSRADLSAAVAGGMRRISFGLESGSQRLLDLMRKGSSVERNSEFIRHAHEAGLSIRCTMFKGFPGETAEDMEATARFLDAHSPYLDRVRFNDFSLQADTPIYRAVMEKGGQAGSLVVRRTEDRRARAEYRNPANADRAYRRAKARALAAVHGINRRPLRDAARQFDGLM
ncbi:B12-binding domain-containing radical SAM protein [Rubellimicrobium aerolatum]|uniref:B12-binding domain-containing radical SAM protein n=1 Tax=Rubellimicrobium aerolatum TaxID=490979 RepID=A0ABW0SH38_9RHOB|nr:B12-binding domain-containing radical SAM protein [Rubellimicrobium aerolatum]MBP1807495.1 tRNA A37 methylthiotransferase MiaB [Rubellimicrobium aerolatum]